MSIGLTTVFSIKGGVGKTSLSLAIQLELQMQGRTAKIITNDPVSPIGVVIDGDDFVQLSQKQDFPNVGSRNQLFFVLNMAKTL